MHRDLRLEHLLLDGNFIKPTLKITGFGYSKSNILDSLPKTTVGAPTYTPPGGASVWPSSSAAVWRLASECRASGMAVQLLLHPQCCCASCKPPLWPCHASHASALRKGCTIEGYAAAHRGRCGRLRLHRMSIRSDQSRVLFDAAFFSLSWLLSGMAGSSNEYLGSQRWLPGTCLLWLTHQSCVPAEALLSQNASSSEAGTHTGLQQ